MILHYTSEGSGPRVLLLHPVGIDLTFLAPLATLLGKRYRVMRMDLRGHGRSPLTPPDGSAARGLDDFAEDVHETRHRSANQAATPRRARICSRKTRTAGPKAGTRFRPLTCCRGCQRSACRRSASRVRSTSLPHRTPSR